MGIFKASDLKLYKKGKITLEEYIDRQAQVFISLCVGFFDDTVSTNMEIRRAFNYEEMDFVKKDIEAAKADPESLSEISKSTLYDCAYGDKKILKTYIKWRNDVHLSGAAVILSGTNNVAAKAGKPLSKEVFVKACLKPENIAAAKEKYPAAMKELIDMPVKTGGEGIDWTKRQNYGLSLLNEHTFSKFYDFCIRFLECSNTGTDCFNENGFIMGADGELMENDFIVTEYKHPEGIFEIPGIDGFKEMSISDMMKSIRK